MVASGVERLWEGVFFAQLVCRSQTISPLEVDRRGRTVWCFVDMYLCLRLFVRVPVYDLTFLCSLVAMHFSLCSVGGESEGEGLAAYVLIGVRYLLATRCASRCTPSVRGHSCGMCSAPAGDSTQ